MMIYQGDNWPAEYRDRIYLLNLFGHRTNVETLERSGSGFVAKRAPEPDIFDMVDPWYPRHRHQLRAGRRRLHQRLDRHRRLSQPHR